jgi:hypothetical protein
MELSSKEGCPYSLKELGVLAERGYFVYTEAQFESLETANREREFILRRSNGASRISYVDVRY